MTPASTSVTTSVPPPRRRATVVVIVTVIRPATSAVSWTPVIPRPSSRATTAPTQVPEATPSVSGVASGLEKIDWKAAPETAIPDPMRTATVMRGSRRLNTTESALRSEETPPVARAAMASTILPGPIP
jgi:hypothetical protein